MLLRIILQVLKRLVFEVNLEKKLYTPATRKYLGPNEILILVSHNLNYGADLN